MADRSRTKSQSQRGNRGPTPNGTDHDGDTTVPADADTTVVVAHHHGHTPDLHIDGAKPHYMGEDGHLVWGTWEPPDTLTYEYLGDQADAHPDDHRHNGTAVSNHETGRESHRHAPIGGGRLPLEETDTTRNAAVGTGTAHTVPAPDPPVKVEPGGTYTASYTHDAAGVEASQARHPSGRATPDGLPTDPQERAALAAQYRHALTEIDGSAPTPDRVPARTASTGATLPGASIGEVGAEDLLRMIRSEEVTDPALQHEMTWQPILLRAVVEMAIYHADNRRKGGTGPELAPDDLIAAIGDAYEQIRQPRLKASDVAREARP